MQKSINEALTMHNAQCTIKYRATMGAEVA